jgi:16S rRNA (guanine527-N7)-methyltransferase
LCRDHPWRLSDPGRNWKRRGRKRRGRKRRVEDCRCRCRVPGGSCERPVSEVEVLPEPPVHAHEVFGERLELATRYASELATTGVTRGLIGPREVPRLWDRHLLNCVVVGALIPPGSNVVDVGSGAGLPGLALAIARPDLTVTLVEPLQRRAEWLAMVVATLDVAAVTVIRDRAEALVGRVTGDVVTARAVAPLARLAAWCVPLARSGGVVLAIKGRSAAEELQAAGRELARLGVEEAKAVQVGYGLLDIPTTVVRLTVKR